MSFPIVSDVGKEPGLDCIQYPRAVAVLEHPEGRLAEVPGALPGHIMCPLCIHRPSTITRDIIGHTVKHGRSTKEIRPRIGFRSCRGAPKAACPLPRHGWSYDGRAQRSCRPWMPRPAPPRQTRTQSTTHHAAADPFRFTPICPSY